MQKARLEVTSLKVEVQEWESAAGKRKVLKNKVSKCRIKIQKSPPSGNRRRGAQSHFARFEIVTRQLMKKLNKKQKKLITAIAAKKDADIDLTDMPEVLDWSKAEIGKFYRPGKKPVTIRLDIDIIAWLKSYGRGYQTKTNLLLRHAMKSSVRAKTEKLER